jgi:hypothetical protein
MECKVLNDQFVQYRLKHNTEKFLCIEGSREKYFRKCFT